MRKREQALLIVEAARRKLQTVTWALAEKASIGMAKPNHETCGRELWKRDAFEEKGAREVLKDLLPPKEWPIGRADMPIFRSMEASNTITDMANTIARLRAENAELLAACTTALKHLHICYRGDAIDILHAAIAKHEKEEG